MAKIVELSAPIEEHHYCLLLNKDELSYITFLVGNVDNPPPVSHSMWNSLRPFRTTLYSWQDVANPIVKYKY